MTYQFRAEMARHERDWGIVAADAAIGFLPDEFRRDFQGACDAQPSLVTTANGGIPFWLTAYMDPEVIRILQAPLAAVEAFGEAKKGDWTTQTAIFVTVEPSGEVASYGDFSDDGKSDANINFPQRQSYLFQTHIEYGEREVAVAGEAKLQLVSEKQQSAANTMARFSDYSYHFGVAGMQNYGFLNDPSLPAALTPATKTAGGVKWINAGVPNATSVEVYNDFLAIFTQLVAQTKGYVTNDTPMVAVLPPQLVPALGFISQFNVKVREALKAEFPNLRFVTAPRAATASGNVVQLWAEKLGGVDTVVNGFNEKMRQHSIVQGTSSKKQKVTGGTWGCIIRQPLACAQMLGA